MSEKFGFNWKEQDFERMTDFIIILEEKQKIENKHIKKTKSDKFRPSFKR